MEGRWSEMERRWKPTTRGMSKLESVSHVILFKLRSHDLDILEQRRNGGQARDPTVMGTPFRERLSETDFQTD